MRTYRITVNIIVAAMLCVFVWYVKTTATDGQDVPVHKGNGVYKIDFPDGTFAKVLIKAPEPEIMSIRELQTALNAQGHSRYSCEVDGKWGPETARALENYICDRNYKESTYGM